MHLSEIKSRGNTIKKYMEQVTTAKQTGKNGAKHWCITVNNYGDADICQFKNTQEFATYYIFGKEVGASGTSHLQCYIAFKSPKTITALKKIWPTGHFEMSLGTPEQASTYCKKDGQFVEWGVLPASKNTNGGESTKIKWETIWDQAEKGDFHLMQKQVLICHYNKLKQIHYDSIFVTKDLPDVCGEWIYGKPGVGKSHTARAENPGIYDKMINKWWDGYLGEEAVLLDDFDIQHDGLGHHLKRWADKYPFRAEVKCFSKMIRPKKIVVTSNYHPNEIFKGVLLDAILRRFKLRELVKIKGNDDLVTKKPKRKLAITQEIAVKKPKLAYNKTGELVPAKPDMTFEEFLSKREKSVISIESDECTTTDEYEITSDEEEYSDDISDMSMSQ